MALRGLFSRRSQAIDADAWPACKLDGPWLALVELIASDPYTELEYRRFVRALDTETLGYVTARLGELHGRFTIELERRAARTGDAA